MELDSKPVQDVASKIGINFRKLRQDYSPNILSMGRTLFEQNKVESAKILHLTSTVIRIGANIIGRFDQAHEVDIEIDLEHSEALDTSCDCSSQYDCQHQAALLFYLESHFNDIFFSFSKETDLDKQHLDEKEKERLKEVFDVAQVNEDQQNQILHCEQLLFEYVEAANLLSSSSFFLPSEVVIEDKAEANFLLYVGDVDGEKGKKSSIRVSIALRLPFRSKLFVVPDLALFLQVIRYQEPLYIAGRRYVFNQYSFTEESFSLFNLLFRRMQIEKDEKGQERFGSIDNETFGELLAKSYECAMSKKEVVLNEDEKTPFPLPCLYNHLEQPLLFSHCPVNFQFHLDYIETPSCKFLLNPFLVVQQERISLEEVLLLDCISPAMFYQGTYYRFPQKIKRIHLGHVRQLQDVTIPEPLLGTFVENALPELKRFGNVSNLEIIDRFVTLPFGGALKGACQMQYFDGELEASLSFIYDEITVPAAFEKSDYDNVISFVTKQGVIARNLKEERDILINLFQGFVFDEKSMVYKAKTEKKIIEFMTEIIPQYQSSIDFHCPKNLLDLFVYEKTKWTLSFKESDEVGYYVLDLSIEGDLKNIRVDLVWECLCSRRLFIELKKKGRGRMLKESLGKILVLDLKRTQQIIQLCDELGIKKISDFVEKKPLWNIISFSPEQYPDLDLTIEFSDKLEAIREQVLGKRKITLPALPDNILATLRPYQKEGVNWLNRFQMMYLNGILADDMGLGKTLQTIVVLAQYCKQFPDSLSLIVCPTSLVYNWKQEFIKFCPTLDVRVVDGIPGVRKKMLDNLQGCQVLITSYGLLQKDVDQYKALSFRYFILDEAQHIKNRMTRNAKSVKMISSPHKLILTGTPVENSLNDLWSLFDFLMPGFLGAFERFTEKYIRNIGDLCQEGDRVLQKKVAPFILRRCKKDVLKELPPVSEMVYHCHLSKEQEELYTTYALSAKRELSELVKREGFNRVQIHVLATLTRLKQICCHPAIFSKESAVNASSAKYDLLLELLSTLIQGNHKIVIFSQYTSMLQIMRKDFKKQGVAFCYLDGSTKNRLDVVNQFNEDPSIPIFLVSLKAGGTGLNLVGADTVIHYDMWWNPAIESQATDRVHRLGQTKSVSSYKLVTLKTIEEKIFSLQKRKKGLLDQMLRTDEDVVSKLTWEEVLELLQI